MAGVVAPYLVRRGGTYTLRIRLPLDIAKLLRRREISRALGTACPRQARERAARLRASLLDIWCDLRIMAANVPESDLKDELIELLQKSLEEAKGVIESQEKIADLKARKDKLEYAAMRSTMAQKYLDLAEKHNDDIKPNFHTSKEKTEIFHRVMRPAEF